MYDFLVHNQLYVVLIIVLVIWIGISFILFRTDKKIKKLEKIVEKTTKSG
jgi:CcmD family protein